MTQTPDYHQHDEFINRSAKLDKIRGLGVEPYPSKFTPTHQARDIDTKYEGEPVGDSAAGGAGTTPEVTVAGRLMLFRAMGKNAFGQIQDESGRIQFMVNRDLTQVTGYEPGEMSHIKFIEKMIDLGDIIGIKGHLFRTMKGEITLFVKEFTLLTKTLLPLPDKHAGLTDKEIRYRKRWLDLISDREVADTFRKRSRIIRTIREMMYSKDFMEVETPALQTIYGGAAARPFNTHLHAHHQDLFLRISLEIPLKKLAVGGMEKIFEISKVFRNEGMDRNHNPEFTMFEMYAAYWDYNDVMDFMEELCEKVAINLHGTTQVGELDFSRPWKRRTMKDAIAQDAGIDVDPLSDEELRTLVETKTEVDRVTRMKASRGQLISYLFEELVEDGLMQPQFIIDYPIETTPLCKPHSDPAKRAEGLVERFEAYVLGHEIANAYSELNDPVMQRNLLEGQQQAKLDGDLEANPLDEEFIEAVCQGFPPTGGLGIGLDRLTMVMTDTHSIRDVLYFPLMRTAGATD